MRIVKKKKRRFKIDFKRLLNKKFLPLYIAAAAVIFVFVIVLGTGKTANVTREEDTAFYSRSTIYVGIDAQNNSFAFKDENGGYSGYDVDVITELLKRAYPEKKIVFREADSQIASYKLKTGEINLAIGQYVRGVTKTQGLSLTQGYYTDDVYAYVSADSGITEINSLRSKDVLVMTTQIPRTTVKNALKGINDGINIISCSSFADARDSLKNGTAGAIIAPEQMMVLRSEGYERLSDVITTVDYRILAWQTSAGVSSYLNVHLKNMQEDGTLAELQQKYGIYKEPQEKQ